MSAPTKRVARADLIEELRRDLNAALAAEAKLERRIERALACFNMAKRDRTWSRCSERIEQAQAILRGDEP